MLLWVSTSLQKGDNKILSNSFLLKPSISIFRFEFPPNITPLDPLYKRTAAPRTPIAIMPVMPAVTIGARPALVALEAAELACDVTVPREPNSELAVVFVAEASVAVRELWREESLAL